MAFRLIDANPQFSDTNGRPLNGGSLTFYSTGTSALKDIYTTSALSTPAANPMSLNSAGRATSEFWMNGTYRVILKDSGGVTIWDRDPVDSGLFASTSGADTLRADLAASTGATLVGYKDAGTSSIATTVAVLFSGLFVTPEQFGATGVTDPNNATDQTAVVQAALNAAVSSGRALLLGKLYGVSQLQITSDNTHIIGHNRRTCGFVSVATAPAYGVELNADYLICENIRLTGKTFASRIENLIKTTGTSYYQTWTNCWFGTAAIGYTVAHEMYWSRFINVIFRDCDEGLVNTSAQDMNAVQFMGCETHHTAPVADKHGIKITDSDGVTFVACDIQNQGIYLDSCNAVTFSGGYWEAFDNNANPALTLVDSRVSITSSPFISAGTFFDIDNASAASMMGVSPRSHAWASGGRGVAQFESKMAPILGDVRNIFPDTTCSSALASAVFTYSPTGANGAVSINGNGHLEAAFTASNQRSGYILSADTEIGVYVKWRVTLGDVKLSLVNTDQAEIVSVSLAQNSDWNYTRLYASASGGTGPAVIFQSNDGANATVEIDDLIVTNKRAFIASTTLPLNDRERGTFTPTVIGTSTAGTATYSVQIGRFNRRGKYVWFEISLTYTGGTGTGNLEVTGLPFTSLSTSGTNHQCSVRAENLTFSNQLIANVKTNSTSIVLQQMATGAAVTAVAYDAAATLILTGWYEVA